MSDSLDNAAAIVGVGAIMPDAPDAATFWRNVTTGRYSISEVDPERWDPALYYDPIRAREDVLEDRRLGPGGDVRAWKLDPAEGGRRDGRRPQVGVACTRMALADAGWPDRPLDLDRTAVIIGNAISGEKHYLTASWIMFPELARELEHAASFASPRMCARRSRASCASTSTPGCRRSPRTRCPASSATASPGRQPVQPPRAQLHHRRGLRVRARGDGRPSTGCSRTSSTSPITGGSIATWAPTRSSSSARSAPCRRAARVRTRTAPTGS